MHPNEGLSRMKPCQSCVVSSSGEAHFPTITTKDPRPMGRVTCRTSHFARAQYLTSHDTCCQWVERRHENRCSSGTSSPHRTWKRHQQSLGRIGDQPMAGAHMRLNRPRRRVPDPQGPEIPRCHSKPAGLASRNMAVQTNSDHPENNHFQHPT